MGNKIYSLTEFSNDDILISTILDAEKFYQIDWRHHKIKDTLVEPL